MLGGSTTRGTQRTRLLENYGVSFDKLAPHLYYHGKHSARRHETPERIRDNKPQYFLLGKSNPITWDRLQPKGTTNTLTYLLSLSKTVW
jgi:hypothetical protein